MTIRMKYLKKSVFAFVTVFVGVSSLSTLSEYTLLINDENSRLNGFKQWQKDVRTSYIQKEPLYITNDDDLATNASSGSGIKAAPYVIEGWNITTTVNHSIYIEGTTKYFVIRNCWVKTAKLYTGIYINGVAVGTANVTNNVCNENYHGIYILSSGNSSVIDNNCDNCEQYGIYFYHSGNSSVSGNECSDNNNRGIELNFSSNSTVIGNTCNDNVVYGIRLSSSGNSTVIGNTCNDNDLCGIYITESGNSSVVENTCNNNDKYGIEFSFSSNSTVIANIFYGNGLLLFEDDKKDYFSYTIENNEVNSLPLGYFVNATNSIIDEAFGQLILVNCSNVLVRDQDCSNASVGISLVYSPHCSLVDNTCNNNNRYGICLKLSDNSSVVGNNCSNNLIGIRLSSSGNSSACGNVCGNCEMYGIYFYQSGNSSVCDNTCNNDEIGIVHQYSSYSSVCDNTCNNSQRGISVSHSNYSSVNGNICNNCSNYGIRLSSSGNSSISDNICVNCPTGLSISSSDNSTVTNNTCGNCLYECILLTSTNISVSYNTCYNGSWGIYLYNHNRSDIFSNILVENREYGLYMDSSCYNCYDNRIYDNFFFNNNGTTSQANDDGINNTWYDVTTNEGNYWSDYGGSGTYSIDGSAGKNDTYPRVIGIPSFVLAPPNDLQVTLADVLLNWTVTATAPGGTYTAYLNETAEVTGNWKNSTMFAVPITGLIDGHYNITVVVTDIFGNSISNTTWVNVTLPDVNSPVFVDNPPVELLVTTANFSLNWTATDESLGGTYTVYLNSSEEITGNWENGTVIVASFNDLSDGLYNVTMVVTDSFGNYARNTAWVNITILDITSPIFVVTPPASVLVTVDEFSLNWVATDASLGGTYVVYLNETEDSTGNWNNDVTIAVLLKISTGGLYNVTIVVIDSFDNYARSTTWVNVTIPDVTPPLFVVAPPSSIQLDLTNFSLNWVVTDTSLGGTYKVYLNNSEEATGNWVNGTVIVASFIDLPDGLYNITIVVADISNNYARNTVWVTVSTVIYSSTEPTTTGDTNDDAILFAFAVVGIVSMVGVGGFIGYKNKKRTSSQPPNADGQPGENADVTGGDDTGVSETTINTDELNIGIETDVVNLIFGPDGSTD